MKIEINSKDWECMCKLMERHAEFPFALDGENDKGEQTATSINSDNITVTTYQNNGAIRCNIYHADGLFEEYFED